jgi:hypothetical protein
MSFFKSVKFVKQTKFNFSYLVWNQSFWILKTVSAFTPENISCQKHLIISKQSSCTRNINRYIMPVDPDLLCCDVAYFLPGFDSACQIVEKSYHRSSINHIMVNQDRHVQDFPDFYFIIYYNRFF